MSDSESRVKVTDKRMFTADGELREDFRHLETSEEASRTVQPDPTPEASEPAVAPRSVETPAGAAPSTDFAPGAADEQESAPRQGPVGMHWPANPSFFDLLGMLAEPIALLLGDARLPDGRTTEDLDGARFHIDLLEVIKQKTAGNLSAEESALLEDLLYRLRLRYVQKTG